ncbi:FAD-dependent monooxygenase [Saccharothrix sp. Mg75]|uniref:FAD-dependent monooxygenase n=1 Tax=Saccharothrix sp. Mg75 TaxID=3445357 RepID=UPI003EEA10B1
MKVLVAGGGVGGLAAAISLHAAGITDVRVVEAGDRTGSTGAGLVLRPAAVRELIELDLFDQVVTGAVTPGSVKHYSPSGELVRQEPLGRSAGFPWPQLSVRREHLVSVLADAVRARLGPDALTTSAEVVACASRLDGPAEVALSHTDRGVTEVACADLVIGADGVGSVVRRAVAPGACRPGSNGVVTWHGTAVVENLPTGDSLVVLGDRHRGVTLFPIAPAGAGRALVAWIARRKFEAGEHVGGSGWHQRVSAVGVQRDFGDLGLDSLDLTETFRASPHVHRYAGTESDPLPRWSTHNATLLGDAAHALCPSTGRGPTEAVVDARVLAVALASGSDVTAALAWYEQERRTAAVRLHARARRHDAAFARRVPGM